MPNPVRTNIVQLRAVYIAQEKDKSERILFQKRTNTWAGRIEAQGPWDEENDVVSLEGPEAIPMPVKISSEESLAPFFDFLASGGSFEARAIGWSSWSLTTKNLYRV